jgi:hypothetical protein
MSHLGCVRRAILPCTTSARPFGAVFARASKILGESDPVSVRIGLTVLVSGRIGEDGRLLPPRRARRGHRRRTHLYRGATR